MRIVYLILIVTTLLSCKKKNISAELKDKEILIQALYVDQPEEDEVKIRIYPQNAAQLTENKTLNERMAFGMDSCFKRVIKGKVVYPIGVTAINNGIKNCYEYLLTFPKQDKQDDLELTYQDQFINKKVYHLRFK